MDFELEILPDCVPVCLDHLTKALVSYVVNSGNY